MSTSAVQPGDSSRRRNKKRRSAGRLSDPLPKSETGKHLAQLFTHPWDWIYASAPEGNESPQWETIHRFPLTPIAMEQQHQDPESLVGIRPGPQTRWLVIDIDAGSEYHPKTNDNWLLRIREALEAIGIARTLTCQSSHRGGLHLYIPLPLPVHSFWFSICIKLHLEAIGIKFRGGQCELFPNPKKYVPKGKGYSLFAAVRLPMQPGSGFHALDSDLNPLPWSLAQWLEAFEQAASLQDFQLVEQSISHAQETFQLRRRFHPKSLDSWLHHIEQVKAQGWSGHGQSNAIFKALGCEARVFLAMDSIEQIADYIEQTVLQMPGFNEHSNHIKDLRQRSRDVAQWALKFYWPNGSAPKRETHYHSVEAAPVDFGYHQAKRDAARQRISQAVEQLSIDSKLPKGICDRADAIVRVAHVSKQTLYKNKPLWHPRYLPELPSEPPLEAPQTQSEQEITQPKLKNRINGASQPFKSLWIKSLTQLLIYIGFVLQALSPAAPALAHQGQRAGQAALVDMAKSATSREVVQEASCDDDSDVASDRETTIENWRQLKLSLPLSLQDKVRRIESEREGKLTESNVLSLQGKLEKAQNSIKPKAQQSPVHSSQHGELELTDREPTSAEVEEFMNWYQLAKQLSLVSDYRWSERQYWVKACAEWKSYVEFSADFTIRSMQRMM